MKKRVLSLLLVLLMIMSLVPTSAFAANDVVPYGVTGGYLYFDRSTGEIVDCDETVTEAAIPSVIRDKEVKRIAAYAFEDCNVLKRITIPSNLTLLSEQAFFGCGGLESIEVIKVIQPSYLKVEYCSARIERHFMCIHVINQMRYTQYRAV